MGLIRRQGLGSKKSRVCREGGACRRVEGGLGGVVPDVSGREEYGIGLPLVGGPYHRDGRGLDGRAGSEHQES